MERISHAESINAVKVIKTGKAAGPSEVNVEMIASRKLCQRVLDGKGMPDDWKQVRWYVSVKKREMA